MHVKSVFWILSVLLFWIVWPASAAMALANSAARGTSGCVDDTWTATDTRYPSARQQHTVVWTGSEMIVWGGVGSGPSLNSGGRYCASADIEGQPQK